MTTRATGGRRRRAAALAFAAILVLTGCGPVNAGSAAAEDFEREFAHADGIASIDVGGSNNLPFLGSATATVVSEAGLSEQQVDELAADLSDYMRTHAAVSWDIELDTGEFMVGIATEAAKCDLHLEIARELTSTPRITYARVGVEYDDHAVQVAVDAPESLSAGYAAAASAVSRLGIDEGNTSAAATFGDDDEFSAADDSRDGRGTAINETLRAYDAVLARFTLTAAEVTPESLTMRAASEDDVEPLASFIAAMPGTSELDVEIQGGKTTGLADATAAADAVASALRGVDEATAITASENFVNVTLASPAGARAVLAAAAQSPDFLSLDGFGVSVPSVFRVFDQPVDFVSSLELAETAAALPAFTSVDVHDSAGDPALPASMDLRLKSTSDSTVSSFVSAMKPALVAGGWDVWLQADVSSESFTAVDQISLDGSVAGDRDAAGQQFADTLVRLWNAAAT